MIQTHLVIMWCFKFAALNHYFILCWHHSWVPNNGWVDKPTCKHHQHSPFLILIHQSLKRVFWNTVYFLLLVYCATLLHAVSQKYFHPPPWLRTITNFCIILTIQMLSTIHPFSVKTINSFVGFRTFLYCEFEHNEYTNWINLLSVTTWYYKILVVQKC